MNRILCICTETHTGMRDFALPIIKAARLKYEAYALYVDNPKRPYRMKEFDKDSRSYFISQPETRIGRIICRFYFYKLKKKIIRICKNNDIEDIWFITGDTFPAPFIKSLIKKYNVYYTIHDLFSHTTRNTLLGKIILYVMFGRHRKKMFKVTRNWITSSKYQYQFILNHLKDKKAYYHPFPTLVNTELKEQVCKEIPDLKNYILFFSMLGKYKGVDLLYNAFVNSIRLQEYKLVIAGSGKIDFPRNPSKESNVIFINRYIKDEEILPLYKNCKAVVLPYRTATQSGNMTYAYYFQKLLLLSDVPYFKEIAQDGETALFFKAGDSNDLQNKLEQLMFNTDENQMKSCQKKVYEKEYTLQALSQYLQKIFN